MGFARLNPDISNICWLDITNIWSSYLWDSEESVPMVFWKLLIAFGIGFWLSSSPLLAFFPYSFLLLWLVHIHNCWWISLSFFEQQFTKGLYHISYPHPHIFFLQISSANSPIYSYADDPSLQPSTSFKSFSSSFTQFVLFCHFYSCFCIPPSTHSQQQKATKAYTCTDATDANSSPQVDNT